MEDQGKRLMIAVVAALAIMLLWNFFFPQAKPPEQKPPAAQTPAAQTTPGTPAPAAGTPAAPGAPAGAPGTAPAGTTAKPRGPEQVIGFDYPGMRAEFSSWGGVLRSWKLLGSQFHEPGKAGVPEDLVRLADSNHRPFTLSFTDGSTHSIPAGAEWRGEKRSDHEVVFTWQSDDLSVEKRYRIHPEDYVLELDVAVQLQRGSAKQGLVMSLFSQQDPKTRQKGKWSQQPREWTASCDVGDDVSHWSADAVASQVRGERGHVSWGGFVHSYFVFAAGPIGGGDNLECKAYGVNTAPGGMGVDLVFPLTTLEAGSGGRIAQRFIAYLGPKYLQKLEAVAGLAGGGEGAPAFEKSVTLGIWGFIAGPLLWLLGRFYAFAGSWGIAIILLTILVKLATLYWTHKSMKSMKEMARLRPQLDKLREKFKDDRQKQQVETMALFKAHGVNPLSGCLPLLLQMPIWFALYRALAVAAELYQAPFLWLGDLTAPDPYFILPVFMTGAMLLQSRLTPSTATGMQQKMLSYGMPIMFGVMGFFFPAGLSLYISTNTSLTLLHHLYMRRTDASRAQAKPGAQAEESAASGSKPAVSDADGEGAADGGERDVESGKPGPSGTRNGQRSRGQGRGKGPGRRGGRRKRSSRSS
ncbi:MAG TPA: membrane protein insertase YidC [Kofleriaceae bacterium]|nr:membrane protein insertase YidC [Kofleriaceae bacterium]